MSTSITLGQLREWRELAAKATPGEWEANGETVQQVDGAYVEVAECVSLIDDQETAANAAFIAAAREGWPATLDALEEAERERDEWRASMEAHRTAGQETSDALNQMVIALGNVTREREAEKARAEEAEGELQGYKLYARNEREEAMAAETRAERLDRALAELLEAAVRAVDDLERQNERLETAGYHPFSLMERDLRSAIARARQARTLES